MNDNHAGSELEYHPRLIGSLLRKVIKESPVVVLTGARQVGKSTLLQNEAPFNTWRYISLDDFENLEQAKNDPKALWGGTNKVIIDEVQKAPYLLNEIKSAVDMSGRTQRFILTGSANLLLMKSVSESLAGRALYYELEPMTVGEMHKRPLVNPLETILEGTLPQAGEMVVEDPLPLMSRGFLPALMGQTGQQTITRFWSGYVQTYLERDLRQLSQVEFLPDYRRVMEALSLRIGQLVNQTDISRDISVSQSTVHRYLNLLETTSLIQRLPAYAVNRSVRLTKAPKAFWFDPGLASFLAGLHEVEELKESRQVGGIFECMILLHLRALAGTMTPLPRFYYWRTTTGKEVDLVVEYGRKVLAIEVKLANTVGLGDISNLRYFMEHHPQAICGIIIYTGSEIKYISEKIVAVPWTYFAG